MPVIKKPSTDNTNTTAIAVIFSFSTKVLMTVLMQPGKWPEGKFSS